MYQLKPDHTQFRFLRMNHEINGIHTEWIEGLLLIHNCRLKILAR